MDASRYLRVDPSGEMFDRSGALLHAFLNAEDQWCFERGLDELGPRIVQATLAAEDQRFYKHPGVDPLAVLRAVWQNTTHGRIVSGGSTLTMQVVKRGPNADRSVPAKIAQAIRALRLERRCSKDDILRTYLNTAPYGLNLVGVEAAARRYFGKPARELTLSEAALIAGLPKAPTTLMPLRNEARARARRNYVLGRMADEGFISKEEARLAAAEPLHTAWQPFPSLAPHLAMRLRETIGERGALRVTLDAKMQQMAEKAAVRASRRYKGDIDNTAIMVVDVPLAKVLAYVGSVCFFDDNGGQVDACRARRSPGSALKPFAYALAMENNVLYGGETLLDDSLDLGAYNPENYDGLYNGMLSAADALRHSLNVPAVMILDRVGVPVLHRFLKGVGLDTLTRPSDSYGLGLTLGDCEVRLDEMMAAYRMLAALGEYRPLTVMEGMRNGDMRRGGEGRGGEGEIQNFDLVLSRCTSGMLFDDPSTLLSLFPSSPFPLSSPFSPLSRGTCLKLYEMMEQPLPEELEPNLIRAIGAPNRVCWKTGTSTGHHDAWAFVFNGQYLVGVWMGNNDGRASSRLVGARSALPVAARVFRALLSSSVAPWPDPANDLRTVKVCAVTGLPASSWCRNTREESVPRGQLLNRICDVHYPAPGREGEVIERWPGAAKGWDLAKVAAPRVAREGTVEAQAARRQGLRIHEPADKGEYILTGETEGDRIRLSSSLDAESALYWYLDDRYLGASNPEAPLTLALSPGRHVVACMTPNGAMDRAIFNVAEPRAGLKISDEKR